MACNPTEPGPSRLSQDPHFQAKLEDVVALYLHHPEHAVVLCVDEKSQIWRANCCRLQEWYSKHFLTSVSPKAINLREECSVLRQPDKHSETLWCKNYSRPESI